MLFESVLKIFKSGLDNGPIIDQTKLPFDSQIKESTCAIASPLYNTCQYPPLVFPILSKKSFFLKKAIFFSDPSHFLKALI